VHKVDVIRFVLKMCLVIVKGNMYCKKKEDTISSNKCTKVLIECKLGQSRNFRKVMIVYCISSYSMHDTATNCEASIAEATSTSVGEN